MSADSVDVVTLSNSDEEELGAIIDDEDVLGGGRYSKSGAIAAGRNSKLGDNGSGGDCGGGR